jgi:small subunit ribosomal protein S16
MVVIRLARGGAKGRPFYHLVVANKRNSRDGKYIERLGYFNPTATGADVGLLVNRERVAHWLANGAQFSDKARDLVKQWDKQATAA